MNSGIQVVAERAYDGVRRGIDTLIIAGGDVYAAATDPHLRQWLLRITPHVRRLASVCSGAFVLAEAGLLDGRRATTHWLGVPALQRGYPRITVEPDAIFVRDGNVYTSAGVTAGIDLALALVEEDLGHAVALAIARQLVVFLKRPGGQSQFSSHLAAQSVPAGPLKDLPTWILDHLDADLSVEGLAGCVAMSPRNFARVFMRELGMTPAKFVERARVDAARRLLEDGSRGLEAVAAACGFASGEHMRRTFWRHLRVVPADYRRRFQTMAYRKAG
jgi:transcriptional regulator GlxA family with amidase domain